MVLYVFYKKENPMKKYFFLLSLLVVSSSCAKHITLEELVNSNSNEPTYKRMSSEQKQFQRDLMELISYSNQLIILKFSASWCVPCKTIAPIVKEVHQQFEDEIIIVEIDVDKYPSIRSAFGVIGIPTFIYYKGGRELEKHHNVKKEAFVAKITKYLAQ